MSAILLDFFGPLVSYSPSRVDQGHPRTDQFVREHGSTLSYPDFPAAADASRGRMRRESLRF